jgi:hypothetical protein
MAGGLSEYYDSVDSSRGSSEDSMSDGGREDQCLSCRHTNGRFTTRELVYPEGDGR